MATFLKLYSFSKQLRIPHAYKSLIQVQHVQRRLLTDPPKPPSTTLPNNSEGILLSDTCVKRLKTIADPGSFLRILVEGGGCSGFQYKFELDSKLNPEDCVFEKDGAKIVVDEESLEFVKGSTVTFTEELIRSAFTIESNPMAEGGCSCGASFSLKL